MLQVFNKEGIRVGYLQETEGSFEESVLAKPWENSLSLFYTDYLPYADKLVQRNRIRTKTNEYIIESRSYSYPTINITAKINVSGLEGKDIEFFESVEQTVLSAMNMALIGTGWTCEIKQPEINVKKRTVRCEYTNSLEVIKKIQKAYRCEMKLDSINKVIQVYKNIGNDKGVYFNSQLNLEKLTIDEDTFDFCTKIIGLGALDENNNHMKIEVSNNEFSSEVITRIWKDERYSISSHMEEDARLMLEELSQPCVNYAVHILDLSKNSDYSFLSYDIGDLIRVTDIKTKTKVKQRIVSYKKYFKDFYRKNTCELGTRIYNYSDVIESEKESRKKLNSILSEDYTISERAIKKAYVSLNRVYVQKLEAVEADIGTIKSSYITTTVLEAEKARINDLIALKADITSLNAVSADIDALNSNLSRINTLITGNAAITEGQVIHLTASNTTIDNALIKSAMIESLAADKITSGAINTKDITIKSEDGGMVIHDNTIQIKDSSKTRVQLGKDASGDYNIIVLDKTGNVMFNSNGITKDAIKSEIIRDDMVAQDANIQGSKINITSLITSINGSSSKINSSNISIDAEGQTLDVAFNKISESVEKLSIPENLFRKSEYISSNFVSDRCSYEISEKSVYISNMTSTWLTLSVDRNVTDFLVKDLVKDNIYTISFYVKSNIDKVGVYLMDSSGNKTYKSETIGLSSSSFDTWIRKEYSFSSTFDSCEDLTFVIKCKIQGYNEKGRYAYFKKFKLEEGYKATEWVKTIDELNSDVESLYSEVKTNSTQININQGKISDLIDNTTIIKDGTKVQIKDELSTVVQDVNSIKSSVSSLETTTNSNSGLITELNSKYTTIEQNLDGISTNVSNVSSKINNLSIGGRNLLRYSGGEYLDESKWKKVGFTGVDSLTVDNGYYLFKTSYKSSKNIYSTAYITKVEKEINISFNYKILNKEEITSLSVMVLYEKNNSGNFDNKELIYSIPKLDGVRLFSKTVTLPSECTRYTIGFTVLNSNSTSTTYFYFKNIKIEEGNTRTAWSPALEDSEELVKELKSQYSTINQTTTEISTKVSSLESNYSTVNSEVSTINQTTTEISTKVSSLESNYSTVNSKVSTMEQGLEGINLNLTNMNKSISDNYTELSSKNASLELSINGVNSSVSSISQKIDNFSVGSRNFLRYSGGKYKDVSKWSKLEFGANDVFNITNDKYYVYLCDKNIVYVINDTPVVKNTYNDTFNISFDYKCSNHNNITNIKVYILCEHNNSGNFYNSFHSFDVDPVDVNTRINKKVTLGSNCSRFKFRLDISKNESSGSVSMEINNIKIEEGSVGTTWTPAIEDVENDIDAVSNNFSTLSQTVSSITASVTSMQSDISSNSTRLSSAELKLSENSLLTTISSGIAGGKSISTTTFVMDKDGFTLKYSGMKSVSLGSEGVFIHSLEDNSVVGGIEPYTLAGKKGSCLYCYRDHPLSIAGVDGSTWASYVIYSLPTNYGTSCGYFNDLAFYKSRDIIFYSSNSDKIACGSLSNNTTGNYNEGRIALYASKTASLGIQSYNSTGGYSSKTVIDVTNSGINFNMHNLSGAPNVVLTNGYSESNTKNNRVTKIYTASDRSLNVSYYSGQNYYSSTITLGSSDIKLKKNIKESCIKALDYVMRFEHKEFDWKCDNYHQDIGYIAQELEKINPQLVIRNSSSEESEGVLQLNIPAILPYLSKAIQEQQKQIEELKKEIQNLNSR